MMPSIVLALLGLASLFTGWLLMFLFPGSRLFAWGILTFGVVLLAVSVAIDFERLKKTISSRKGRLGIAATVGTSLFIGIILLANGISLGSYRRFDLTGLSEYTLTSQTKEVLADLAEPVEVISMFTPQIPASLNTYANNLLSEYQIYTDLLTIQQVDPELQPDRARRYGLNRTGAIVGAILFQTFEGQRFVYGPQIAIEAEHAFTSAILEVTGTRQKKVYFLKGHDESSVYQDYSNVREGLKDNLFFVDELDLSTEIAVPDDMAVLVIAGPRMALSEMETTLLTNYLESGGRLLMLLDPDPPEAYRQLVSSWVIVENGYLVDPESYVTPNRDNPLVSKERNSLQIEETFFTGATAIVPKDDLPSGAELSALVWTSAGAWMEQTGGSGNEANFDTGVDRGGPLAIGALITIDEEPRMAIIGDSDFAANQHFRNGANSDLFLTVVNWLTAGEEIISIDRKILTTRRLILNPEQARFLVFSSIGLLPLLFIIVSAFVWWRRR